MQEKKGRTFDRVLQNSEAMNDHFSRIIDYPKCPIHSINFDMTGFEQVGQKNEWTDIWRDEQIGHEDKQVVHENEKVCHGYVEVGTGINRECHEDEKMVMRRSWLRVERVGSGAHIDFVIYLTSSFEGSTSS